MSNFVHVLMAEVRRVCLSRSPSPPLHSGLEHNRTFTGCLLMMLVVLCRWHTLFSSLVCSG